MRGGRSWCPQCYICRCCGNAERKLIDSPTMVSGGISRCGGSSSGCAAQLCAFQQASTKFFRRPHSLHCENTLWKRLCRSFRPQEKPWLDSHRPPRDPGDPPACLLILIERKRKRKEKDRKFISIQKLHTHTQREPESTLKSKKKKKPDTKNGQQPNAREGGEKTEPTYMSKRTQHKTRHTPKPHNKLRRSRDEGRVIRNRIRCVW